MSEFYHSHFEHWRWELPEQAMRMLAPAFRSGAESKLQQELNRARDSGLVCKVSEEDHDIPHLALLAGNEAYPESAIADPITDLRVWYDWRSGVRKFPYPGSYEPLEIRKQRGKIPSAGVIGVVGEILTGLYAQSGIDVSPWSRPIWIWPDLIFQRSGKFHFVEAKGTVEEEPIKGSPITQLGNHAPNLREFLVNTIRQFGAEAWVTVWGSFVGIHIESRGIDEPLVISFTVTLLEMRAPAWRQSGMPESIPKLAAEEMAIRAIQKAKAKMDRQDGKGQADLIEQSRHELRVLLDFEAPEAKKFTTEMEDELLNMRKKAKKFKANPLGRRDKLKSEKAELPFIARSLGSSSLVGIPISQEELQLIRRQWTQKWDRIQELSVKSLDKDYDFYRAGACWFGLVPTQDAPRLAEES